MNKKIIHFETLFLPITHSNTIKIRLTPKTIQLCDFKYEREGLKCNGGL